MSKLKKLLREGLIKENNRTIMTSPFIVYTNSDGNPKMVTINYVDEFKSFIKTIPDTWDLYDNKRDALSFYQQLTVDKGVKGKGIEFNEANYVVSPDNLDGVVDNMKDSDTVKIVDESNDPCWKNHKQVGMKTKDGKEVPNCVPVSEESHNGSKAPLNLDPEFEKLSKSEEVRPSMKKEEIEESIKKIINNGKY